jgi:hypothetical protein
MSEVQYYKVLKYVLYMVETVMSPSVDRLISCQQTHLALNHRQHISLHGTNPYM